MALPGSDNWMCPFVGDLLCLWFSGWFSCKTTNSQERTLPSNFHGSKGSHPPSDFRQTASRWIRQLADSATLAGGFLKKRKTKKKENGAHPATNKSTQMINGGLKMPSERLLENSDFEIQGLLKALQSCLRGTRHHHHHPRKSQSHRTKVIFCGLVTTADAPVFKGDSPNWLQPQRILRRTQQTVT